MHLEISGDPIPWQRAVPGKRGMFDNQKQQKDRYRWLFKASFPGFKATSKALKLKIDVMVPIPKYMLSKVLKSQNPVPHSKKPDVDNFAKFVMDCFSGFWWEDDNQISDLHVRKFYSLDPKTLIEAEEI